MKTEINTHLNALHKLKLEQSKEYINEQYEIMTSIIQTKSIVKVLTNNCDNSNELFQALNCTNDEYFKLSRLFLDNDMFEEAILCNKLIDHITMCGSEAAYKILKNQLTRKEIGEFMICVRECNEAIKDRIAKDEIIFSE